MKYYLFALTLFLSSCGSQENGNVPSEEQTEYAITRSHHEMHYSHNLPAKKPAPHYQWDEQLTGGHPQITKEYFRCKGNPSNTPLTIIKDDKEEMISDCAGCRKHSLPIRDKEEFVYPILIDLLNYVQEKTEKKVIITSGHRCPTHNTYVDPANIYSKHMLAAEVTFYLDGMEQNPEHVVQLLLDYYTEHEGGTAYQNFKRYEKSDTNVSTQPWFNKEVYIKLVKANEGRNFDNNHPYPYIDIQVRHDCSLDERVTYSWAKANRSFYTK